MCSHYTPPDRSLFLERWSVEPPADWTKTDLWPGYSGPFLRRPKAADAGDEAVGSIEAVCGTFGLLPFWAKDVDLAKRTYNARSETAADKPSFREAWKRGQHCIIPAAAIYEPDWRSGKAVPTRIERADGVDLGIAGLWEWCPTLGLHSMTMLTINADDHELMRNYHKPDNEKRMVVILPRGLYSDWLDAPASNSMEFMHQFPADRLVARPEPHPKKRTQLKNLYDV